VTYGDRDVDPATQAGEPVAHGVSTTIAELTHETIRDQLNDRLDRTLDERDHERIEQHLAVCPSCRAFARSLEQTVEALGDLSQPKMPGRARERLLQRLNDAT